MKALVFPGDTFGRLTVLERVTGPGKKKYGFVACSCACGTPRHVTRAWSLRSGATRSCGCLRVEVARRNPGRPRATRAPSSHRPGPGLAKCGSLGPRTVTK